MLIDSFLNALGLKKTLNSSLRYHDWISEKEKTLYESMQINTRATQKISIVVVLESVQNFEQINKTILSILEQVSPNWELLISVRNIPKELQYIEDKRVRLIQRKNEACFYISANEAAQQAQGSLLTFLKEGDQLSTYAVASLNECKDEDDSLKTIISDEDYLNSNNERCDPFFKPDWNPDYLTNYNYFSQAVAYDRKLFIDLCGFNFKVNDPYHDLALRATDLLDDGQIGHISKILFHLKQHHKGEIYRTQFDIHEPVPLVTVIIPTKDQLELLKTCLDGLFNNTNYENIEIIVIDNQSQQSETLEYLIELEINQKIRILRYDKPFNYSEMNNIAVRGAKGSLLCFLNNDISMIKKDWLTEMVSQAIRPEIGCVGAKLLYPDGTIQHAGVILGLKGYASHAHKGFEGVAKGYFNRLQVVHNVSAVTAACMVVRKEVFESVGGFDATNLKVAYNDVDLCLKVREAGYRNLFTPHAQLIHHESKSRGKKRSKEQQKQLRAESAYLLEKWGEGLFSDPAYNKNLTLLKEDFSLGFDRINK